MVGDLITTIGTQSAALEAAGKELARSAEAVHDGSAAVQDGAAAVAHSAVIHRWLHETAFGILADMRSGAPRVRLLDRVHAEVTPVLTSTWQSLRCLIQLYAGSGPQGSTAPVAGMGHSPSASSSFAAPQGSHARPAQTHGSTASWGAQSSGHVHR